MTESPRPREPTRAMLDILHEDNHCLVVNKPAGLARPGGRLGRPEPGRPGARRPEGALPEAGERLRRAGPSARPAGLGRRAAGEDEQGRRAAVRAVPERDGREGLLGDRWRAVAGRRRASGPTSSGRIADRNVVQVVEEGIGGGKGARTRVPRAGARGGRTFLELRPLTGRSHQIRVQLASRGLPIVGDRKYGSPGRRSRPLTAASGSLCTRGAWGSRIRLRGKR